MPRKRALKDDEEREERLGEPIFRAVRAFSKKDARPKPGALLCDDRNYLRAMSSRARII